MARSLGEYTWEGGYEVTVRQPGAIIGQLPDAHLLFLDSTRLYCLSDETLLLVINRG